MIADSRTEMTNNQISPKGTHYYILDDLIKAQTCTYEHAHAPVIKNTLAILLHSCMVLLNFYSIAAI